MAAGTERMRSAMQALDDSNQALLTELGSSVLMFKMVAEDLEAEKQTKMVNELEQSTKEIIGLMEEFECYSKTLQLFRDQYTFGDELTDFQKLLSEEAGKIMVQCQSQPEHHKLYQQFKEAIWKVNHAGEPMPGQEKEDLIITCSQLSVINTKCPISGRPIVELDDPVRSADCMHIYDRAAVMEYLKNWKRNRQQCPCAAAGCPKPLVRERLICDPMLKVDIQELRMRDRVNTQVHDVADCTEIDD